MKKIILAAVFAALSLPVNSAPVAVRVAPVRVSVPVRAPVTVKSVAPIKSVTPIKATPALAVKAATPVKSPAPTVTKPDPLVKPASKIATPPVAATTATTAALVATGAALTAIATMAWIEYTDQEVEAVKADGSTAVMNVNPQFTVLCDSTQYAHALQWRDQCRNHGQIQSSYCAVVAFNRLCDPATPEQVAGRTRVPDYTNVFFK